VVAAKGADVIIMVVDAQEGWTDEDTKIFETVFRQQPQMTAKMLVINKIDQAAANTIWMSKFVETFDKVVSTSAILRKGFEDLEAALLEVLDTGDIPSGGQMWTVNQVLI
jgi:tRNA modification GTPase